MTVYIIRKMLLILELSTINVYLFLPDRSFCI